MMRSGVDERVYMVCHYRHSSVPLSSEFLALCTSRVCTFLTHHMSSRRHLWLRVRCSAVLSDDANDLVG